jgi:hypothetical protein
MARRCKTYVVSGGDHCELVGDAFDPKLPVSPPDVGLLVSAADWAKLPLQLSTGTTRSPTISSGRTRRDPWLVGAIEHGPKAALASEPYLLVGAIECHSSISERAISSGGCSDARSAHRQQRASRIFWQMF